MRDDGIMPSVGTSMPMASLNAVENARPATGDDDSRAAFKSKDQREDERNRRRLAQAREWYAQEMERQRYNRYQMALDEAYYDGLQWTEEEARILAERGQSPTVYNEIKPTIDWMIGTERRTRIDYKVLPRESSDGPGAEVKSNVLKYLGDVNKQTMARSKAFAKEIKAGLGWLEIGVSSDPTQERIFYRSQDWRTMLYDSNSVELDLSDARYVHRWRYIDSDLAEAYFPGKENLIRQSTMAASDMAASMEDDEVWYLGSRVTPAGQDWSAPGRYLPNATGLFDPSRRPRARLVECWYREPRVRRIMRDGIFDGEEYIPRSAHDDAIRDGSCYMQRGVDLAMRCIIYCDAGMLWEGESPYRHNRFPFVPVWGYRRSIDNAPYGAVRQARDPQDALNKSRSKALWLLSSNQIDMEEGAVDDVEELREEAARPDAILVRRKGFAMTRQRDGQLAEQHVMLAQQDQAMIRNVGGVTSENLGRPTNADSGKAIIARSEQGGIVTTELFDNHRFAIQLAGEIELSLVEQFMTRRQVIRIVGERGNPSFVTVNDRGPDGKPLNDITATQADFIVSEQDYRDSLRIAMFESLFDITSRLAQMAPQVALQMLDLVFDMADLPGREEIVARIRKINGQREPGKEPSPEEMRAEEQAKQEQEQQKQLVIARALLELAEIKKKVSKLDAESAEIRMSGIQEALQAAITLLQTPGVGPIADELMRGAGYQDQKPEVDAMDRVREQVGVGAGVTGPGQPQPQQQPQQNPLMGV